LALESCGKKVNITKIATESVAKKFFFKSLPQKVW